MREIRTSGSEGGETGQPVFPTPISADAELILRPILNDTAQGRAAHPGLQAQYSVKFGAGGLG